MRQPQNKSRRHWNALLSTAILTSAFASSTPPADETTRDTTVFPMPATPLYLSEINGLLFVSMSLNGLAWLDPDANSIQYQSELLTLEVAALDDQKIILAGRDSVLRVAQIDTTGRLEILYQWQAEGIPTALERENRLLAVASGGAGLTIYQWDSEDQPPQLLGRYPFITYARDLTFFDRETLLLADPQSATAWLIDISDPIRPRKLQALRVRSYCDVIAADGKSLAATDRLMGTVHFNKPLADPPGPIQQIPALAVGEEYPHVQAVRIRGNIMLIAENETGVRYFVRESSDANWEQAFHDRAQLPVFDAIFLEDNRIAIAEGQQVRIEPIPPEVLERSPK